MNCYHQFTIEERENRFLFHEKGCAIREFARRLKQSPSTISRELLCKKRYRPNAAQRAYQKRRKSSVRTYSLANQE